MTHYKRLIAVWILVSGIYALPATARSDPAPQNGTIMHVKRDTSMPVSPPGLDAFWKSTLERLARVPMDASVENLKEPLPYRELKVTVRSLDGIKITGLLSLPVAGEDPGRVRRWPVIITTSGYGGKQQGVMLADCMRGFAVLQVFPRGQGASAADYTVRGGDKLTMELDHPEGAYYQGAYADVIRMIDFVTTRKDLDTTRIAFVATSQGGGIGLCVAALDHRIRTVVAHVPFLCNMPLAATMPSLVKQLLDRAGKNNAHSLETLEYFDPYQLAPRLHIPVLMSAGGKDHTCPKQTIESVYERIPGKKKLLEYPDLTHTTCLDFYQHIWPWLDRYMDLPVHKHPCG